MEKQGDLEFRTDVRVYCLPMANKRGKPPAWLSIDGSPKATSGARAVSRKSQRIPQATVTRTSSLSRKSSRNGSSGAPGVALSDNARTVLERRYLAKDGRGRLTETPEQLFRRVARNIAEGEAHFG